MKIIIEIAVYILIAVACYPAFSEEYTIKQDYYDSDDRVIYSEDGSRVGTVKEDYYDENTQVFESDKEKYRIRENYYSNGERRRDSR